MTVAAALVEALGTDVVVSDPDVMDGYRYDRATTVEPGRPVAVVRARSTDDVQAVLRIATAHRTPVVPRGAGTGLSGGAAAVDGCIVLSTERMRALAVDAPSMTAMVGPGLLNAELKAAARAEGLWYPPDPSSFEICSIGGNVATNAGGICCVKYGVTTDYVLGLTVVLADGTAVQLGGRTIKDVAGYDLKRLFVGSEGTLGVVTEAILRLRPPPLPMTTVAATFPSVVDAGRAVVEIVRTARPSALELMDGAAVDAVQRFRDVGFDPSVGAVLLAQTEAVDDDSIGAACRAAGALEIASTEDPDEGELLMGARRMVIPSVEKLGAVLIEDVGVPIPRIPEFLEAVAAAAARHDTRIPVIGHAGDGNFHPLVSFDAADPDATARAGAAFDEIMEVGLRLGGTITGEHGVGVLKARHLAEQLGPDVLALSKRIKAALDPDNILNPGKWV